MSQPTKSARARQRIALKRSSSFTLAVIFTLLLTASIILVIYFMHSASKDHQRALTSHMLFTDIQAMQDQYETDGLEGLANLLQYRLKRNYAGLIYALATPEGNVLVGNFAYLPNNMPKPGIAFDIDPQHSARESGLPEDKHYTIMAAHHVLDNGYTLLVGRNVPDTTGHQSIMYKLGSITVLILIFLAAAGFFIGDRVVYRINLIADTADYIIHTGDLSHRIPVPGNWDDLSKLAHMLNDLFARIEQLMDDVRQVSDAIAHDLRTPLTRLKNQLEALQARSTDESLGLEEETESMIAEADHILNTFSALLRIRNIEAGKWHTAYETLPLHTLVSDVVEYYEALAEDKEQTIHATLQDCAYHGDKHLLFQAFANIMDNAVKYAPHHSTIQVTLDSTQQHVSLTIANSAPRMDDATIPKLFDRFYRTDKARQTKDGTGLGLSLSKAIILSHGGTINAQSTTELFSMHITLPLRTSTT